MHEEYLMTLVLYFVLIAFVVFADLFTKYLVKGSELLMSGGVIDLIPGVFRFRYVENPGAAMGSFTENRWVFMVFSTVAIVAIALFLILKHKSVNKLLGVALSLVTGGGIGNMYERLFNQNAHGQYVVTDFFDFYLFDFWKWVFNVADMAVCVGAGLMFLYIVLDVIADIRAAKHPERHDELVALDMLDESTDDILELYQLDGVSDVLPGGVTDGDADDDSFLDEDEVDLDALEEIFIEEFEDGDLSDEEDFTDGGSDEEKPV